MKSHPPPGRDGRGRRRDGLGAAEREAKGPDAQAVATAPGRYLCKREVM
ncbi:MAG: hypothetical protein NTY19_18995 [Planctomycetota bacterium]|nr:hypothetical protein [Planctomycetota bacterium]